MNLDPGLAVVLAALILIGGPIWLISNAVERRRARRALAAVDHATRAEYWFDMLGPLSHEESTSMLRMTLFSMSMDGVVTWQDMLGNVALARRVVRERAATPNPVAPEPEDTDAGISQQPEKSEATSDDSRLS